MNRPKVYMCPPHPELPSHLPIHTMEYYSAIESNAFESVLMRWMNLQLIIHSAVSEREKDKYCVLTHIYGI